MKGTSKVQLIQRYRLVASNRCFVSQLDELMFFALFGQASTKLLSEEMYKTISFGELLWDLFPNYKKPGGSPANLAYHLHNLGNQSYLVSRVGNDQLGKELTDFITEKGLSVKHLQTDDKLPTGKVTVTFKDNEPSYSIEEPSAWDSIEYTNELEKELTNLDAFCFASLSQRNETSTNTLLHILEQVPEQCLIVFDLNLRSPFINKNQILQNIDLSDVIKVNEDEFKTLSAWLSSDNLPSLLLSKSPEKKIILTRGGKGSTVFTKNGEFHEPASPISGNGDFVGVGDSFLACITHLILSGSGEQTMLKKANKYAAFVASNQGGMPPISQDLVGELLNT